MAHIDAIDKPAVVSAAKRFMRPSAKGFLRLHFLPPTGITPEVFAKTYVFDVELMLSCLRAGAWLEEDWRPFVRYTIAKRLRVRSSIIFQPPFDTIKDEFLDLQLNGAGWKAHDKFSNFVAKILRHPSPTAFQLAGAKLILSIISDVQVNALIQPFHWIRTLVAVTEPNSVYGLARHQSEMQKQKVTLCEMLRATL